MPQYHVFSVDLDILTCTQKKTQWVQTLQTLYANLQQLNSKTTVPTISIHFENVKYNLFIQQLTYQNNHIKQTTYKYLTYWNVCHF